MKVLDAEKIRKLLDYNFDVFVYDEVTSTNDVVKNMDNSVVFALTQTAGRGRMGRSFYSGSGGLYFSISMRIDGQNVRIGNITAPFSPSRLTIAAGIAVCKSLKAMGFDAQVKWVNDVYVGGKKVCGILAEGYGTRAVLGIGVNLSSEIPSSLSVKAASLDSDADGNEAAALIINTLLKEIASPDMEFLTANCFTLGKKVATKEGEGIAVDIDESGALLVEIDGVTKRFFTGEANLL